MKIWRRPGAFNLFGNFFLAQYQVGHKLPPSALEALDSPSYVLRERAKRKFFGRKSGEPLWTQIFPGSWGRKKVLRSRATRKTRSAMTRALNARGYNDDGSVREGSGENTSGLGPEGTLVLTLRETVLKRGSKSLLEDSLKVVELIESSHQELLDRAGRQESGGNKFEN